LQVRYLRDEIALIERRARSPPAIRCCRQHGGWADRARSRSAIAAQDVPIVLYDAGRACARCGGAAGALGYGNIHQLDGGLRLEIGGL
jgi:hypothetical protein